MSNHSSQSSKKQSDKNRPLLDESRWPRAGSILLLIIITILLIAPFANKAFHIDDPLFLWSAKHIQSHPTDPYRFNVTWYFDQMEMWQVMKNPPFTSYYIAFVAYLVGWGEKALHLAFLLPAIAVVLGTYFLARKLCARPVWATLAGLITPVFIVSSTTVMCDVMMLAFWVWAIFFWIRGTEGNDPLSFALSAFLVAVCALTKYYGMSLIILLFAYTLIKKREIGLWVIYLFIPILILTWYQWETHALYGRGLLLDAGAYASEFRGRLPFGLPVKGLIGLAFTGGCLISLLFYTPFLWSRSVLFILLALSVITILALSFAETVGIFPLHDVYGVRWSQVIQLGIMVIIGMNWLALAVTDLWHHKGDSTSLLLFCWVMGTFTFATFINWSVNGRSILPMAPAAGILLGRRITQQGISFKKSSVLFWPLLPTLFVALSVTWADYGLANSARSAVERIYATYGKEKRTLWFQGHWGFQYYMEWRGAKVAEMHKFGLASGDILVVPENNWPTFPLLQDRIVALQDTIELHPSVPWLTTMNRFRGAGFYSDIWGPLPFVMESALPERYHILQVVTARPIDDSANVIGKNREESDKAIADYTQKLSNFSYDPETFHNRGKAYCIRGEYEKAISDYTQALMILPYYGEVYYDRGNAYFLKGEYHKAISDYTQLLRMDSRDFKTYLKRGNAYTLDGEYDKAIFDFGQALRIHPNDPGTYHNRAVAYFKKGDYDQAWEDVKKVKRLGLDINPAFLEQLRKSSGRLQ